MPMGVVLSFLAMMAIPVAITLLTGVIVPGLRKKPRPAARAIVRDLGVSVVITAVVTLAISFVLDRVVFEHLFFRPTTRDHGVVAELDLEPETLTIDVADDVTLHGWLLRTEVAPRAIVVHYHGSDLNITATTRHVAWLREHGFHVVAVDYRGYGQSTGSPSRAGVIEDAVATLEFVRTNADLAGLPIVLLGQSMGGQLAIHAAAEAGTERVAAVIADATYGSPRRHVAEKVARMGPGWIAHWAIWCTASNSHAADGVVGDLGDVPLLVLHGTADRVVAPAQSERLHRLAGDGSTLWLVEGARHLHILRDDAQQERLLAWLGERLPAGAGQPTSPPASPADGTPGEVPDEAPDASPG